jgi:hypothetical protein
VLIEMKIFLLEELLKPRPGKLNSVRWSDLPEVHFLRVNPIVSSQPPPTSVHVSIINAVQCYMYQCRSGLSLIAVRIRSSLHSLFIIVEASLGISSSSTLQTLSSSPTCKLD